MLVDISIIIPVKDEAANVSILADEIKAVMADGRWQWECVWIDDGSGDDSLKVIKDICENDANHRCLVFEKNAGQSAALWAGFQDCRGKFIATLDGDRQNDPADIPVLIKQLENSPNVDMVNGYRLNRRDNFIRKISSRIANGFRNMTTGKTVRDVGCSTRVFKRECVAHLPVFAGLHRFLPTLVAMRGFRLAEAPVNHRPRQLGQTKYNINNRLWVGLYDIVGVMWLKKRGFHYSIVEKFDPDEK